MKHNGILERIQEHVTGLFEHHTHAELYYHNLSHTHGVVMAAKQIADHYQLNERDYMIVIAAAWFHDTGYLFTTPDQHEKKSAELAIDYLNKNGIDTGIISEVEACILATKMPQRPIGLLQQIVCDSDMFHLGSSDFSAKSKLLRKEVEARLNGGHISKETWNGGNISMISIHQYHTDYARLLLNEKKQENLDAMLGMLDKKKKGEKGGKKKKGEKKAVKPMINIGLAHEGEKEKKQKEPRPEKGIETVFKTTSGNNQRLSSQADSKAHIMIQVNSILISVLLTILLRNIDRYPHLAIPSVMLLCVNLVTIIFSILATRPQIPAGTFNENDLKNKKINLLFFGNFYKMSLEQYSQGMRQMMDDYEFLYGSLIRDVYFQGISLGRKYKLLRLSYNVFMYGLIASVITFIIAAIIFNSKS